VSLVIEKANPKTQAQVALDMGVTQQVVSHWLKVGYMPLIRARDAEALYGVPRRKLVDPKLLGMLDDKGAR